MNTRKILVSVLMFVCISLSACAPAAATQAVSTSMDLGPTLTPYQATATAEAETWPVTFVWQVKGRGPNNPDGFGRPTGIAVDSQSNVYIVDGSNHRIQKFDTNGKLLTSWGSYGDGQGQFMFRMSTGHYGDVAVDGQDNVYVVDYNERVQKFDANGKFLMQWGAPGSGDGQFSGFLSVGADEQGNVYVSDDQNFRIQKFDGNGKFLMKWGSHGGGDGQFGRMNNPENGGPAGIAIDRQGNIFVNDPDNHRVEKFDSNGQFLAKFGNFVTNLGIAVDAQGNVYVTDNGANTVSKFDGNGKFLFKWGKTGENPGQFSYPEGIAIDQQGNIYVVNTIENIEKFTPK